MAANELAWRVEETCFNAFPGLRQVLLGGWLVRFADRLSRRANSANPLGPDCAPVETVIEAVERLYRRAGQTPIFRIPSVLPGGADAALAGRGYAADGETCVLYGGLGEAAARPDTEVVLDRHAGAEWLAGMAALQRHDPEQRSTYRRIVRGVAVPAAFAALRVDGRVAALAYGAVHDRLLCYESVVTDPRRRRQGLARRVIGALAAWGREEGAEAACLQVAADNAPALELYHRFGLTTELHRYHYRQAPAGPG